MVGTVCIAKRNFGQNDELTACPDEIGETEIPTPGDRLTSSKEEVPELIE